VDPKWSLWNAVVGGYNATRMKTDRKRKGRDPAQ